MGVITLYEFAALVGRMRRLQVKYLETRQRTYLDSVKELERQIDAALLQIQMNVNELNAHLARQNVNSKTERE